MNNSYNKKSIESKTWVSALLIIFGALLYAVSMYVFTIPAKLTPGGISGIASMIQNLTGFSASYTILICNIPLIVLAFIFLSRKFCYLSLIGIITSSLVIKVLELTNFYTFYIEAQPLYALVAGGALSGIGIGIMLSAGGSSGGTDIISLLIQKKFTSLSISWIILIINVFVITVSSSLYYLVLDMSMTNVLLVFIASLIQVFVSSKSMDLILNGLNSAVKFEIICKDSEALSEAIMEKLHRGVTIVKCIGAFEKRENEMIVCIVSRTQISQFKKIIKNLDPTAFAYTIETREVLGNGFRKNF